MKVIEIKQIDSSISDDLSDLLANSPKKYIKYFTPFNFDSITIKSVLDNSLKDTFFGIFINQQLIGFYMLRGWDAGYEIPSYGVFISSGHKGIGLGKLTLLHAISFCRLNQTKKLMLKVHPENLVAKKLYENMGFIKRGVDNKNNNLIYFKEL